MESTNFVGPMINTALRSANFGARFVFVILIAKFAALDLIGQYGLIVAYSSISILIIGLELHHHTIRLNISKKNEIGFDVGPHFQITFIVFVLVTPILIIFNPHLKILVIFLILFEYLGTEIYRFLIALQQQVSATFLLLIRQCSWIPVSLYFLFNLGDEFSLLHILVPWSIASGIGLLLGVKWLIDTGLTFSSRINFAEAREVLFRSVGFYFVSSIAMKLITVLDRAYIEKFSAPDQLSVYIFFFTLASVNLFILDAAVISYTYQGLIKKFNSNDTEGARRLILRSLLKVITISFSYYVCLFAFLDILLDWLGNDIYSSNKYFIYIMSASIILQSFALLLHYILYAAKRDAELMCTYIWSFSAFIVVLIILPLDVYSLLWAFFTSQLVNCITKIYVVGREEQLTH